MNELGKTNTCSTPKKSFYSLYYVFFQFYKHPLNLSIHKVIPYKKTCIKQNPKSISSISTFPFSNFINLIVLWKDLT